MKNTLITAFAMLAFCVPSTFASTYSWNLVGPTSQLLGNSTTLISTTGNISMKFSGFLTNPTDVATSNTWLAPTAQATALYAKNSGGDEVGLGIAADPTHDNEIFKNSYIQIDLNGLLAQKAITAVSLVIGSVQPGEGFSIWGSNTAGKPGTLLLSGTSALDDVLFAVPSYGTYRYVSVSATADNILLDSVTANTSVTTSSAPTPEPGTMALGIIALAGMVWIKMGRREEA